MIFATNQKRHRHIADPAVAAEVEENRDRFLRGEATISLAEMLHSIEHPGVAFTEDQDVEVRRRDYAANETVG